MKSYPKINLFLRVVGKRADGYHELETFFYPLSGPADEIVLSQVPTPGITISSNHPGVPANSSNLCIKALMAFCSATGVEPHGFHIDLTKRIPVAAGMGGGSSDAASVLLQMNAMFPGKITWEQLGQIAAKLGADVPFFLNPKPAVATGIGERFSYPEKIPAEIPILIAAPCFPVSAKWAYQHWNVKNNEDLPLEPLVTALQQRDFKAAAHFLRNDLQYSVIQKFPVLQMISSEFLRLGAERVLMSGSGPTMFAMFESFEKRDAARNDFRADSIPVRLF